MSERIIHHVPTGRGLGDAAADCVSAIRGYPGSYAFKGSGVRWTGVLDYPGGPVDNLSSVQGSLEAAGFYNVSVSAGFTGYAVTLYLPIDFGNINDVAGIINSTWQANGYKVEDYQVNITNRPSDEQICGGSSAGQPTGPPIVAPGQPPTLSIGSGAGGAGIMQQLEHVSGLSGISLAIGLGIAFFVLKGR